MSRFRVGDRARFVQAWTSAGEVYVGQEVTIVGLGWIPSVDPTGEDKHCQAAVRFEDGVVGGAMLAQLEPLRPDGWQLVPWDACIWRPESEELPA